MRSKFKYTLSAALSLMFGLLISFSASAQHRGGGSSHGGGSFGGGSHGSFGHSGGFSGGSHGSSSFGRSSSGSSSSHSYPNSSSHSYGHSSSGSSSSHSYGSPNSSSSHSYGHSYPGNSSSSHGYTPRTNSSPSNHSDVRSSSRPNSSSHNYSYSPGHSYSGRSYSGRSYSGRSYSPSYHGSYGHNYYGRSYGRGYNRFYGHYGYYNRYYLPRLGFHISVLPYGYYPFWWGDYQYFYSDGYYYRYDNDNYTVVEPPLGAVLNSLPSGAKSLLIDGEQYYELNGVYYQAVTKDDGSTGYQIAGKDGELTTSASTADAGYNYDENAPSSNNTYHNQDVQSDLRTGNVVSNLPADCNTVKIDGQKYFVSPDGYYFQEELDSHNKKTYRVAGTPDDQPGN